MRLLEWIAPAGFATCRPAGIDLTGGIQEEVAALSKRQAVERREAGCLESAVTVEACGLVLGERTW